MLTFTILGLVKGAEHAYLHNIRVGEGVKENIHVVPQFQSIDDVIMVSCGHLH